MNRKLKSPLSMSSNGVDCDTITQLLLSNNREILFVGAMDFLPNVDGTLYFANKVLPNLWSKFLDLTFRIVGRSPVPEIWKLNRIHGIEVTGRVEDLEPYYRRSALCVVPLRAGGGTRLKILEAMAYGRPVVSTSIGCEGIEVQHNKHFLIADRVAEISNAISSVLTNTDFATFLVKNARSLTEKKYSWAKIADRMYNQYFNLLNKPR